MLRSYLIVEIAKAISKIYNIDFFTIKNELAQMSDAQLDGLAEKFLG